MALVRNTRNGLTGPNGPRGFATVALLACLAFAAACGSTAPDTKGGTAAHLDASHPFGGDPAAEGTPTDGGTVKVGMYSEASSFDPAKGSSQAASSIYDSLLKDDAKGNPQPYLARSMTTPDNGTTWLLGLRAGVVFQDDTPLNAAAVIFNVQRHIDDKGSRCHLYTLPIVSMRAIDPLTVTFTLSRPTGSFPSSFALPYPGLGSIGSPTAIKKWGADYGEHPVGAGPFSFVQWSHQSQIVVKKFPKYWQKGLPRLDKIIFRPLQDTESRYASVANADVDVIFAGYHDELYRSSADPNLVTYYGPAGGAMFIYFNFSKPPFNDRRMREAVIRAINPDAERAALYKGVMDQATTAFGPKDPYYSKAAGEEYPSYDPKKAKALIASYVKDGGDPTFKINASNNPNDVLQTTFLQAQYAAVGLKVQPELNDFVTSVTTVVQGGKFQMATWESGPWESPYPYLYNTFHTDGPSNYGKYSNPQMDTALDEAVGATDPAKRIEFYQQAQQVANKDLAVDWLARAYKGTVTRKNVHGIIRYLSGEIFWPTVWLSK